jgi:pilus assembly protein CpaE
MTHSVLIAAPDQTTGYELRAQVEELADFSVVEVAESTQRLIDLVAQRDPEIVLIHEQLGPTPVLQTIRDLVARRPGTAILLLNEELSPEVFSAAMDAGARGVLPHPVTHEDLDSRLTASAEWVTQMRRHLSSEALDPDFTGRGRLVAVAGSKGGVGTTTIAVHLAHDAVTRVAGRSVCVVDLNLDNGDLADVLGITHRLDISDLAKVADDLSAQTIGSAIHRSTSGLSSLLGPSRIEDIGEVGERETVLILAALRRQFDLVIVDCGASVTPASAAAVESADEVLLVCTPDLLALRGTHRTTERWKRVGAREPENVKIIINKVNRDSDIQPDTAARLLPTAPIDSYLPEAFKTLQRGLNHQDPGEIHTRAWWARIEELAAEVGTVPSASPKQADGTPRFTLFKPRKAPEPAEQGQATLEFAGMIPIVLFLMVLLWQVALWGVSAAYTSHAADEAAREAGIQTSTPADIQSAALDAVPTWIRSGMEVHRIGNSVKVTGKLPMLLPSITVDKLEFTSDVPIVEEDGR